MEINLPYGGERSIQESKTITASGWSSSNIWTLNSDYITATNIIELIPAVGITATQLEALQEANIVGGTQVAGSLQLVALGTKPTINIPVVFVYRFDT